MSESRVDNPQRSDLEIAVGTIKISNVDIYKDGGYYECEVIDHLMNSSSDRILIEILGKLLHALC